MEISDHIDLARTSVRQASANLLKTFAAVPDDKLGWSPATSSRTPLWILGHCATANHAFAGGIRGDDMGPEMTPEEFGKMVWEAGKDTATREEAVKGIENTTAEVLAALDALKPEDMQRAIQSPFGPIPMSVWITFAGGHMMGHYSQIEYIETIWGDHENHMAV